MLDILKDSQEHLDADHLYRLVKHRDPRIGLATVYRTLALLKEYGLVQEYSLGEGHGHFETVPEVPHYHFTCLNCKRVIEFEAPSLKEIVKRLSEKENIQITDMLLSLSGYCSNCNKTFED